MIVMRQVFQTQFGKTQDIVALFKQGADMIHRAAGRKVRIRLLTDLSGPLNTIVQETEYESLAEAERVRAAIFADPAFQQANADNATALFVAGHQEFYTLEATTEP